MSESNSERKVIHKECRFVVHLEKIDGYRDDTHIVKEIVHYDDGTIEKELRTIKNFKRSFFITKPHLQTYKEKKESEKLSNVNMFKSTQSDLARNIATRLGGRYVNVNKMRDVIDSPYLYGTDISSSAIIKRMYMKHYGEDKTTPLEVATLDIEADIDTEEMTVLSLVFKERSYTAILRKFLHNEHKTNEKIKYLFDKYVPDNKFKNNFEINTKIFDTEIEMLKWILSKAHHHKPDIISIWNIDYDMPKMLSICEKYNVAPEDIFSDPDIPKNLRYFKYKEGMRQHITESGKFKPVNPEEQWHVAFGASSFYWIDMMSSHRYVRVGGKTVPGGYSLDNILNVELGKKYMKLKFEDETKYKGIEWHYYMSKNKPLEYTVYNIYDCLSMLILDDKTKDLSVVLPMLSGYSDWSIFNSGPKKIVDALHFFYLERGKVLGVKPSRVDDDKILGLDNWIAILPSHRVKNNGLRLIEESELIRMNTRAFVYDSDAVSSYPSNGMAANVSKDTTKREVIDISGIDKETFKKQNMNLFYGPVNNLEYGMTMFNTPSLFEMGNLAREYELEESI